jgi:Fic family protein
MPPKAQDVKKLMKELLLWLRKNSHTPPALVAGIAHFGINAIHPFYDANGRTARLITRWILKLYNYDLKGLYCLEKHYAMDLHAYYDLLGLHGIKSYEEGAEKNDCTEWLAYFLQGMKQSFLETIEKI